MSDSETKSAPRPTRIGIIGAGMNAANHARYYAQSERTEVVAVADPLAEAAESLAREVGARPVSDYTEFLDGVDAVVVSSPNRFHRAQAVACAEAGKHVYCEKPMGLNFADAQAIASAVRSAGVKCAIGFSTGASAVVRTMRKHLVAGDCGELVSICSRRMMNLGTVLKQGWRADHKQTGGLLYEINIHEIEWMMRLGGPVKSVYARFFAEGRAGAMANDHLAVVLNFGNGAFGMHQGSQLSPYKSFFKQIDGTAGSLAADRWNQAVTLTRRTGGDPEELGLEPALDVREDFLNGIERGAALFNDFEWGLEVMRVAEAIFRSAAEERLVGLETIA